MINVQKLAAPVARGLATSSLVALAMASLSSPVQAQETAQATNTDDTIVVTGTRRTDRTVLESAAPVDVFTADDFKAQPAPQLQTILQTLVPSFNQQRNLLGDASAFVRPPTLRGLPSDQILVLINNKRMHRSALVQVAAGALNAGAQGADLSQISAAALGRVEVLRDGAAAQYGSDAIAGVINLGLRRDTGYEVTARYGQTYEGDGQDTQLTAFWGTELGKDGGFFNLTGEFIDQNIWDRSVQRPVVPALANRGIITDFPTGNRLGGPENRAYRAVFNMELPAGDTTFYAFGNYGWQRQGNDFNLRHPVTVTAADGVRPIPGRPGTSTIGRSVNPVFTTRVGFDSQGRALWDNNGSQFDANFGLPGSGFENGFVPFFEATNEDLGLVGGFKGEEFGINYDISLMYGTNQIRYFMSDTLNVSLGPASPTEFYMGKLVQREFNFNADFNVKKDIGLAEPLFIAWGLEVRREAYEVGLGDRPSWEVGQFASQRLVNCRLPAVPPATLGTIVPCATPGSVVDPTVVRTATSLPGSNGFQGFGPASVVEGGRNNYSGYLDLEATVVDGLDLGVAARYDYFNDFGSTFNGKFSARWAINDIIAIRGTASTGFRAPTPGQQFTQNLTTGFPFGSVVPLGIQTARPDSELGKFYLAEPLKPEKSTNFSAGAVLTPGSGFNVTFDYYNIEVRDRIGITGNIDTSADVAFLVAQGIPGAQELGAVRYFTNAFTTRTQGFDFVVTHATDTGFGRFNSSLAVNYNKTDVTDFRTVTGQLASGRTLVLQPIDAVRRGNIEGAVPRWRGVLSTNWVKDIFDATLRANYYGNYTTVFDPQGGPFGPTPDSGINTLEQALALYPQTPGDWTKKFGAQWAFDIEVGVTFEERYRIAVGAQNLFNTFPERETRNIYPGTGGALNGSIYSDFAPIGQMGGFWYLRASAKF
jgi:iron complex outermembrane receptor protein